MNAARKFAGYCTALAYGAVMRRGILKHLRSGMALPVVVHALSAEELARLFEYLAKNGVINRLELSFDDGWKSVKSCVKVLETYGVKAKVFIAPGETMRGNVWTDEAAQLGIEGDVWRRWYALDETCRRERLDKAREPGRKVVRNLLDEDEVKELSKHPLITIENHTWSHLSAPHRPVCEVLDEVRRAQETLTRWTGRSPQFLAWPFGRGTDELDRAVRDMGLIGVYTRQGYEMPYCRNMAIEGVTHNENVGRILGAWPRVGCTL